MQTFRAVIDSWPSRTVLADDVGVTRGLVQQWWNRDRIPDDWWRAVVAAAGRRGLGVTLELLAQLAEQRRAARRDAA